MYHRGVDSVSGFVLAGGKSSRMGQDKAFVQLGGRTLCWRMRWQLARAAAGSVQIVGSAEKFAAFGPVVEDIYPGQGPLAGIHAALAGTRTELNLIIAVDMPFLRAGVVKLSGRSGASHRCDGGGAGSRRTSAAALCRLPPGFAEVAERSLRAGENKIDRLFSEVETRVIEQEELEAKWLHRRRCSAT